MMSPSNGLLLKGSLLLLSVVLILLSFYIYSNTIFLPPANIHSWAQTDRYALALGFIENDFDLFHPRTFTLELQFPSEVPLKDPQGITSVDFPIHEYLIAFIMKITKVTPFIFRLYILTYSLVGLLFLFLLSRKITLSNSKSFFVVLLTFTAPVFTYYQAGFLPTIPSIANAIIAYYFFFTYRSSALKNDFYLSIFFFSLATLSRTPFAIFLFATFCQQFLGYLRNRRIDFKECCTYVISFTVIISYYLYNGYLARKYGSVFLNHILPANSIQELKSIFSYMYDTWGTQYFSLFHYIMFLALLIMSLIGIIKGKVLDHMTKDLLLHIIIAFTGVCIYFGLMSEQFGAHDYYFLDSFFIAIILGLIFLISTLFIYNLPVKIAFLIVVLLCIIKTKEVQAARYSVNDKAEITRQDFTDSYKLLDSLGIPGSAKMLVFNSNSYNIPLLHMKRKGYTTVSYPLDITTALQLDFDYIAIQDQSLVSDLINFHPGIINRIEKIGGNGKISIYKLLNNKRSDKTLRDFLQITKDNILLYNKLNFEEDSLPPYWKGNSQLTDKLYKSSHHSVLMNQDCEYSLTFEARLNDLKMRGKERMLLETEIYSKMDLNDVHIITVLSHDNQSYFYFPFMIGDYYKNKDQWQKLSLMFLLPACKSPDDVLSFYIWNRGKEQFNYDDVELTIFK
jgi:hypothetical protein